jgi:hypothetical protein
VIFAGIFLNQKGAARVGKGTDGSAAGNYFLQGKFMSYLESRKDKTTWLLGHFCPHSLNASRELAKDLASSRFVDHIPLPQ